MNSHDPTTPLRAVYDGAGDAASIISSTMNAYPSLRAALDRAGLTNEVNVLATSIAHKAQIIALADALEYLAPILESALADRPADLADFHELRLAILRERDGYRSGL